MFNVEKELGTVNSTVKVFFHNILNDHIQSSDLILAEARFGLRFGFNQ
jgi:hypothetical protein